MVEITELIPRADRDLVMAKLATPVTDIAPVTLATAAPATGETLQAVGYGRTSDTWVPNRPHAGAFTVTQTGPTTVAVTSNGGSICMGDAGGPALRETEGGVELVAVHSVSWQAGCLGSDETRTGAVETRLDDVTEWIKQVRGLPQDPQVASGDFNGDGKEDVAAFYRPPGAPNRAGSARRACPIPTRPGRPAPGFPGGQGGRRGRDRVIWCRAARRSSASTGMRSEWSPLG
ncbi:trypsin-like serine protease [Streptomyces sp. NPDC052196]|uniref:trypsin-like serine protease n=1 Tax=Streptomyces sp. NPDC052196 TaxID=3156691 RepID=UPI00343E14B2